MSHKNVLTVNTGGGATIETLSSEDGPPTPPNGHNFNFSGSIAGGSAANGAIEFITPGGPGATTDGQMDAKVLVDGTTVTINGSNQLVASGAFKWTVTTSTAFTPANNTGYILRGASLATITLPPAPALDFIFGVVDSSGNLFVIAQNAGDTMQLVNSKTTATTGAIASTLVGDEITLVCWAQGPGASWIAVEYNGNLTVT